MMSTRIKVFPSITLLIGLGLIDLLAFAMGLFLLIDEYSRIQLIERPVVFVFCMVMCFGCPIIVFFGTMRRVLSIVTIDENGIRRAVFGRFFKMEMTWTEIKEIRYYQQVLPFVFISKNVSLDGMCMEKYNKILKRHDVIQIGMSLKVLNIIKMYYKDKILDLPRAIEKDLYKEE